MNFYELLFNRGQPSGEGMTHFERLFAAKLVGGGEIKELEGVPPLLFKANGEPLIDWSIYGNTVQNGTPTPDDPIQPSECGERTANLLDWSGNLNVVKGTATTNQDVISSMIDVHNINTLYFTGDISLMNSGVYRLAKSNSAIDSGSTVDSYSSGFTGGVYDVSDCNFLLVTASVYGRPAENKQLIKSSYMCNVGSTALPYEPYGYKIPISSANTTTPVYLGEVESTRKIKKVVLNGSEDWTTYSSIADCYRLSLASNAGITGNGLCSHYEKVETTSRLTNGTFVSGQNYSYFKDTTVGNLSGWLAYIAAQYAAGTPVTVWYVLATPETAVVNEPLMKIGGYADSLTATQAGVEVPTIKGNNTLDIDTTVKPSNVYIKYKT